jgi:hypothetical protein
MARGLDHIVHAVRDLDAAAYLYCRLGFTVGARNRHPWGTHNHIVQLPGFFIELLTVAEPEKLGDDGFSKLFGAFNRDFIARHEGLSLLIAESTDINVDQRTFENAGIAQSDVMRFERVGKRPDGTEVKLAFSLAFARDEAARGTHFAACQQHYPENFWNPAFQRHDNSVKAIAGIVMVASDPAAHRDFVTAFTGATEFHTERGEVSARTPRGTLSIMTPQRFATAFGGPLPEPISRLQAIRFLLQDIEQARRALCDVRSRDHGNGFVVDASDAMGAVLSFEPATV